MFLNFVPNILALGSMENIKQSRQAHILRYANYFAQVAPGYRCNEDVPVDCQQVIDL